MRYALLLPVIFVASVGSAYASALQDGMRPESDAVPTSVQASVESFEALSPTEHTSVTQHSAAFVHADSASSALRSGMRPE